MPGIESFSRRSSDEDDHIVLNARSIPTIDAGIANIKLGVFSVVCRRLVANPVDVKHGIALAHAVKCAIFGESSEPIELSSVIDNAADALAAEIESTLADETLRGAVALAYAAEIIRCAWKTGNVSASLRSSSDIIERGTKYGIEVPNIVELWGPSAINRFFVASIGFMQLSIDEGNL